MSKLPGLAMMGLVLAGLTLSGSAALAGGGRMVVAGHPYHNGYYFVPPASAYEAVRVRPPFRYGVPAYYIPSSYLPPGETYYFYPPADYPYIPAWRAGGYYMSAQGYFYAYPW